MSNRIHIDTQQLFRIAGSAVTAAAVLTAGAPATANAVYPGIESWAAGVLEHVEDMASAMTLIEYAVEPPTSYPLLQAGCAKLHNVATVEVQQHLPAPDPALTAALQDMINDYDTFTHICVTLKPSSPASDFAAAASSLGQANAHLARVNAILDADIAP